MFLYVGWTRAETEHLLDLCGRFDLRFTVIQDRWDRVTYPKSKSIEDLKVGMQLIYWLIGNFPMIAPLPPTL